MERVPEVGEGCGTVKAHPAGATQESLFLPGDQERGSSLPSSPSLACESCELYQTAVPNSTLAGNSALNA